MYNYKYKGTVNSFENGGMDYETFWKTDRSSSHCGSKRAQDDAYDLDEFDEDFEDEDTFEDEVEAPAAEEAEAAEPAEEAEAAEEAEVVKSEIAEEDKVVLGEGVETADLDGDGKADAVYVDLDKDGKIDAVAVDTDDDGKADKVLIDTDGDGVCDTVISTEEKAEEAEEKKTEE